MRKAVLAGCGGISHSWLKSIEDFSDVRIVGLVDLNSDAIEAVKNRFGLEPVAEGNNLERAIKESGADTVFDCTVPSAHKSVVLTALSMNCDVLGEKPMAESIADAKEMVKASAHSGKTYAVIQNRRYNPNIIQFRDTVQAAAVGPVTTLNADFYLGVHFGGFRDVMEHVLLVDMAIHSFDEARFISGSDPVSVYCHEWNPSGSWYRHGASAVAIFEMSNGVVFTYRGSWCSEGLNTSWECDWRSVGEIGSITWDGAESVQGEKVVEGEEFKRETITVAPAPIADLEFSGHAGVIREFLDCLKNGTKPQTDCTDNIMSVAMVHSAVESAVTGTKVDIRWE